MLPPTSENPMDLIGPLQLRCMHYIWKAGPSTVHQVHDAINKEKGAAKLGYTTILTVMRNLARRKILDQTKTGGRSHTFVPLVDAKTYTSQVLAFIRDDYFGGDAKTMVKAVQAL